MFQEVHLPFALPNRNHVAVTGVGRVQVQEGGHVAWRHGAADVPRDHRDAAETGKANHVTPTFARPELIPEEKALSRAVWRPLPQPRPSIALSHHPRPILIEAFQGCKIPWEVGNTVRKRSAANDLCVINI